jgi:hypothetical protein
VGAAVVAEDLSPNDTVTAILDLADIARYERAVIAWPATSGVELTL